MSPWALFTYAQDHPPRSRRRRVAWGIAVLVFCGALLPLAMIGTARQWAAGDALGATVFALVALLMAGGILAAVVGFVQVAREPRATSNENGR